MERLSHTAASPTSAGRFLLKAAMKTYLFKHREVSFTSKNVPSPSEISKTPNLTISDFAALLTLEEAESTEIVSYSAENTEIICYSAQGGFRS